MSFRLTTDACDYGWGAVFEALDRDKVRIWSVEEKKWHINVKETVAVWGWKTRKPSILQNVQQKFGPLEFDLFASRLSHKLPRYSSWLPDPFADKIDAFSFPWRDFKIYAFPSFSLILKTVRKAVFEKARGG